MSKCKAVLDEQKVEKIEVVKKKEGEPKQPLEEEKKE